MEASTGPAVPWFGRSIELDGTYYVYFRRRELTPEQKQRHDRIQALRPRHGLDSDRLFYRALAEMDPLDNPNVTPMTGRQLLGASEGEGLIPQFDHYFESTRRLTLIPLEAAEFLQNLHRSEDSKR